MSNSAKLSARERIESLVDANSFVEIGGMITKRNTDFNMQEKAVPADGVVTGYGVVNSGDFLRVHLTYRTIQIWSISTVRM